jgi:DNA-binding CsgD family transcriptional regulator
MLPFSEAGAAWLETRQLYLAPATYADYQKYLRTLSRFFGSIPPEEITADQIRAYQRSRVNSAQAGIINKETSVLQQMLKRIGRWSELANDFQPLPLRKESAGRAISVRSGYNPAGIESLYEIPALPFTRCDLELLLRQIPRGLLSRRELELLPSLCQGLTYLQMSMRLRSNQHYVKGCMLNIMDKLGVSSRIGLVQLLMSSLRNPL